MFGGKTDAVGLGGHVQVQDGGPAPGLQGDGFAVQFVFQGQFIAGGGAHDVLRAVGGGDRAGGGGGGSGAHKDGPVGIAVEAAHEDFGAVGEGEVEAFAGFLSAPGQGLHPPQGWAGLGVVNGALVEGGAHAVAALFVEPRVGAVRFDAGGEGHGDVGRLGQGRAPGGVAGDEARLAGAGCVFALEVIGGALLGAGIYGGHQHVAGQPGVEALGVEAEQVAGGQVDAGGVAGEVFALGVEVFGELAGLALGRVDAGAAEAVEVPLPCPGDGPAPTGTGQDRFAGELFGMVVDKHGVGQPAQVVVQAVEAGAAFGRLGRLAVVGAVGDVGRFEVAAVGVAVGDDDAELAVFVALAPEQQAGPAGQAAQEGQVGFAGLDGVGPDGVVPGEAEFDLGFTEAVAVEDVGEDFRDAALENDPPVPLQGQFVQRGEKLDFGPGAPVGVGAAGFAEGDDAGNGAPAAVLAGERQAARGTHQRGDGLARGQQDVELEAVGVVEGFEAFQGDDRVRAAGQLEGDPGAVEQGRGAGRHGVRSSLGCRPWWRQLSANRRAGQAGRIPFRDGLHVFPAGGFGFRFSSAN